MKKKLFLSFTLMLFFAKAFGGPYDFPTDDIPDVDQQIGLYKRAFKPLSLREDFRLNPKNTHIEGLVPLTRIAYRYVRELLESHVDSLELLNTFWIKTAHIIESKNLTLKNFKNINTQLAFLLGYQKKKGPFWKEETLEIDKKFYASDDWKDLQNYHKIEHEFFVVQSFPFCFEAILYDKNGEFSLNQFISAYLDEAFPIGLTALCADGRGPHGNYVEGSLGFYLHDLAHWGNFSSEFLVEGIEWAPFRSIAQQIWKFEKIHSDFLKVGLFMLLHEYIPGLCSDFHKTDLKTLFQKWVVGSAKKAESSAPEIYCIRKLLREKLPQILKGDFYVDDKIIWEEDYENFCSVSVGFRPEPFEEPLVAATLRIKFHQTKNLNEEIISICEVNHIANIKEALGLISKKDRFLYCGFADQNLTKVFENLNNYTEKIMLSRKNYFDLFFLDNIKLLNLAYGKEILTSDSIHQEIQLALFKFFIAFYQKYQDIFLWNTPLANENAL
ncbi:hypothetical protein [Candidatus Bealeia paramacronuclearis]|uniref:hypothetical protein n=1 Tax=Candidatus Bealeia paramacronuclearis TaxID=1921001 RepID=UPI0030D291DA